MKTLPLELTKILESLITIGVRPVVVGGSVRDYFLELPAKDYDIEIFGIESFEKLQNHLENFGNVKLVGKSFGVLKLKCEDNEYDFALPRTEEKISFGHRGFEISTDSFMSFEKASKRRDFTINSIGYDYKSKTFLDPNEGIKDIKHRRLRHIDDSSFIEDPLRVYRAIQFCARFELSLDKKTKELCILIKDTLKELAKERICEEFKKLFLKSKKPSIGLTLLKELEVIDYFPELKALIGCIQEYEYHPEGDVWIHTLMVVDEMAKLKTGDDYQNFYLMMACLCHDLGKPLCTKVINGKITSHKHESLGIEPTKTFLNRITNEKSLLEKVIPLVQYHLSPFQLYLQNSSDKAIKRLALKTNIKELCIVALADCLGRDIQDKDKCTKAIEWLSFRAKMIAVETKPLEPLILGRDLIELGFNPSKQFKEILEFAYTLQIDEDLSKDDIIQSIKKEFGK